jgi:diguanylate cyclase
MSAFDGRPSQLDVTPVASGPLADFTSASRAVLTGLRDHLGLPVWLVTRHASEDVVVLTVVAQAPVVDHGARLSTFELPLRVLPGFRGVVADSRTVPEMAGSRVGPLLVGSCIAAPIVGRDGTTFGSILGVSPGPAADSLVDALPLVDLQARLLGGILDLELRALDAQRRAEKAESEALVDPVTGLRNERAWRQHLDTEEHRCIRYGAPAGIIILRLDDLAAAERVEVGGANRLLSRAAGVLATTTRSYDVVARLDDTRLAVLLPDSDLSETIVVADRLDQSLSSNGVRAALSVASRDTSGDLAATWAQADAGLPGILVA